MRKLFILSLLAMMIAWGIGGCGGGSGGTSADPLGTDSITSFADAAGSAAPQVTPNGALTLKATVKNAAGTAVVGREVSFTIVSNASGATLISSSANTDGAGEATILYRAGATAGSDVVRASISNGARMDVNITVAGSAGGSKISVNASTQSLAAGQNSILTATVTDVSGNLLSGQAVTFAFVTPTTIGSAITTINGVTDGSGRAVAVYTAGSTGTASVEETIQATVGVIGVNGSVDLVKITSTAGTATGYSMAIAATVTSLKAGESSVITATVTNTATGAVASGQLVTFTFVAPTTIGSTITTLNGTTDGSGRAIAVYTAGSTGTASIQETVKATVGTIGVDGSTGAVTITRTAGTAVGYSIAVTATVTSLAAGQSAVVTATVTDGSGNPASGQTVKFALLNNNSGATLATLNGGNTDSSGKAVTVYTAGTNTPASSLQDVIQASVTGSTGAIVMTRTAAGGGVGTGVRMTVTATPTSVIAGAMSVIVAQVNKTDGTAAAGLAVNFQFVTNTSGALPLTVVNATTDASGTAIATYTAGSNSPALSIQDTVSASVTGSAGAAIITRLPAAGTGNRISLAMNPATTSGAPLGTTSSNCIVTATVLRDDGVTPVAGATVTFSKVTGGGAYQNPTAPPPTVNTITVVTDDSGKANAVFTAPGGATGFEAVVRAQISGTANSGDAVGIIYW